ncbi:hypothetical protein DL98DRAFT_119594 [Cadophora sp. DSE1049]|nr:hypothetical protein DL98DRAFT_119594 [Cadophora sp. DSE1049]
MDVNESSGRNKDRKVTLLQYICQKSNIEMAKLLVSRGVNINTLPGDKGIFKLILCTTLTTLN